MSKQQPKLRLEWRTPEELEDNPRNWRDHPKSQMQALDQMLSDPDVGWAGACLFNEKSGKLIDGHGRKKLAIEKGEKFIPVLIGSWSDEAEAKILATLDPIASMARANSEKQSELLDGMSQATRSLVESIFAGSQQLKLPSDSKGGTKLEKVLPAPEMTWVLLGIPTARFGEISGTVQSLGEVPEILLETLANGG